MKNKMLAAILVTILGGFSLSQAEDSQAEINTLAKTYPLKTCLVSDEKLGEMGPGYDMIYKEKVGDKETDRLVRFCCKGCVKDFNKEPAKYLTKLNNAVAKKS